MAQAASNVPSLSSPGNMATAVTSMPSGPHSLPGQAPVPPGGAPLVMTEAGASSPGLSLLGGAAISLAAPLRTQAKVERTGGGISRPIGGNVILPLERQGMELEPLERLEKIINSMERRANSCEIIEGSRTPLSPRALTPTSGAISHTAGAQSRALTPNFWREVSPQLSYIDGGSSCCTSYGRSVSWNLAELSTSESCLRSGGGLNQDHRSHSHSNSLYPDASGQKQKPQDPIPIIPRFASDTICSPGSPHVAPPLILPVYKKSGAGPKPGPSSLKVGKLPMLKRQEEIVLDEDEQQTVGPEHRTERKPKIQKRLSFGDTLETETNIYTPADEVVGLPEFPQETQTSGGGSSTSLERRSTFDDHGLVRRKSLDTQSCYSYYMDKDLRYYFQHPWLRVIVAYLVIFCNFLLFAEDPVSHSHTESRIPVVGNVFSFVATKYPEEWYWKMIKVLMWLLAILCGMLVGKVLIHGLILRRLLRLKMFRDDQGSWMMMFMTVIVSLYMFSYVYNLILLIGHEDYAKWEIGSDMDVTNESMMKGAATCTWLGDLITALMVTDMMLQDNLYPHWATGFRRLYRISNIPRILIFWFGSVIVATIVIFLIVSDYISWDKLNKGFVETTELSRAFLASFILVMDLLIVMQDWDFPHFTSTIDVNLPGFSTHTLIWSYAQISVTGKWFNYGIIFCVMILDLNMWKNQLFYEPEYYGQYIHPTERRVYTIENPLELRNSTIWTWDDRGEIDPATMEPYRKHDMYMYSRWMDYSTPVMCLAFVPTVIGFILLISLVVAYGRFPANQDGTYGGRLKKMKRRSSWKRERREKAASGEYQCKLERTNNSSSAADLRPGGGRKEAFIKWSMGSSGSSTSYKDGGEETNKMCASTTPEAPVDGCCCTVDGGGNGNTTAIGTPVKELKTGPQTMQPRDGLQHRIYRLKQVFIKSKTTNL